MSEREVAVKVQGEDEEIAYAFDVGNWGSNPSDVVVSAEVWSGGMWSDVSEDVLEGSVEVEGNVITLPVVKNLVAGKAYRIYFMFTSGGMVYEPYLTIHTEN
jgi:hypothetical protein